MGIKGLQLVSGYDRQQELGELFREYEALLIPLDEQMAACLAMQNYSQELLHLQDKYGQPDGRLYLAYIDGKLAGCVALRRFDDTHCELKRLFVRPEYRGIGLGKYLLDTIVTEAKTIGYRCMLLDTMPGLATAVVMYKRYGFQEIEKYYDNPVANTIYMKLPL